MEKVISVAEEVTPALLKTFEALKEVPEDQLQWLIDNSNCATLQDGDQATEPGTPMIGTNYIISGKLRLYFMMNGSRKEIADFVAGDITGYLPFSRAKKSNGYGVAIGETRVMTFPAEKMEQMIRSQFELTQALVHVMTNRVRDFTALQQQNEKMLALGKLSAGLAHELNNPASAIVRDSLMLKQHLRLMPEGFKKIINIKMSSEQVKAVKEHLFKVLDSKNEVRLTLKERTARETELADWLDEKGVENSYELAENFVDFDFKIKDLEDFNACIPDEHLSPVFSWINSNLITEKMVDDINESSKRIADLVASVKTFTHMDRGSDKQYADIHIGIGNTLTMLGYKLRKCNIQLVEDYDRTLPPVNALIGELNQVWTNLIDNALDAMEPACKGTLTIKTERDTDYVQVSIIDNGPGIPEDIRSNIFDPFFTTKEMGKGTGMGLEVVQRIVKQHNGTIKVKSQPGNTAFIVCFPING